MGREKLMEPGLLLFSLSSSSDSTTFDSRLFCLDVPGGGMLALSTLDPRLPCASAGDITRCGGSRLLLLLCPVGISLGSAGTGGASAAGLTAPFCLPGDGERKVRSVMLPELLARCRPPLPALPPLVPPPTTLPLPVDDCDPRRTMRFVCTFPTGSGDEVCDRKAAAAAAEERAALDAGRWTKAWPAAAVAALIVLRSRGYGWSACERADQLESMGHIPDSSSLAGGRRGQASLQPISPCASGYTSAQKQSQIRSGHRSARQANMMPTLSSPSTARGTGDQKRKLARKGRGITGLLREQQQYSIQG
jgi:hypothetical protein